MDAEHNPPEPADRDRVANGEDREVADWSRLPAAPLVSVYMLTYRHAPYIRQALDSVLSQQMEFPIEICLGEDGSDDGTREICLEYAAQHAGIIRLFLRDRSNAARLQYRAPFMHNQIETIKACRGKYIAFIEGDDYWTDPLKLRKQVAVLETHPEAVLCHTNVETAGEDGRRRPYYPVYSPYGPSGVFPCPVSTALDLARGNTIATATVLYRNMPEAMGDREQALLAGLVIGDYPLYLFLARHGEVRYLDEVTAVYRRHGGGVWTAASGVAQFLAAGMTVAALAESGLFSEPVTRQLTETACRHAVHAVAAGGSGGDVKAMDTYLGELAAFLKRNQWVFCAQLVACIGECSARQAALIAERDALAERLHRPVVRPAWWEHLPQRISRRAARMLRRLLPSAFQAAPVKPD